MLGPNWSPLLVQLNPNPFNRATIHSTGTQRGGGGYWDARLTKLSQNQNGIGRAFQKIYTLNVVNLASSPPSPPPTPPHPTPPSLLFGMGLMIYMGYIWPQSMIRNVLKLILKMFVIVLYFFCRVPVYTFFQPNISKKNWETERPTASKNDCLNPEYSDDIMVCLPPPICFSPLSVFDF